MARAVLAAYRHDVHARRDAGGAHQVDHAVGELAAGPGLVGQVDGSEGGSSGELPGPLEGFQVPRPHDGAGGGEGVVAAGLPKAVDDGARHLKGLPAPSEGALVADAVGEHVADEVFLGHVGRPRHLLPRAEGKPDIFPQPREVKMFQVVARPQRGGGKLPPGCLEGIHLGKGCPALDGEEVVVFEVIVKRPPFEGVVERHFRDEALDGAAVERGVGETFDEPLILPSSLPCHGKGLLKITVAAASAEKCQRECQRECQRQAVTHGYECPFF